MAETKNKTTFFYSRTEKGFIVENCRKHWKNEVEEVLERAKKACANTFVFTHRWDMERCEMPVSFGEKIDWTYQYKGDFEWTVNLNRARFMAELGQAYWLTGEEKFAEAYIRLMKDWIAQNPLTEEEIYQSEARQYNVKDTWRKLDSGIRITNWIKGYFCVRESPAWTDDVERLFHDALKLHGNYLSIAYTPHDKQSNWGFLETNGLFQIAILFPELEESSNWLKLAVERLETMCRLQVFEDGMHNEQSPMYHHEVLHCLFEPVLLARINHLQVPQTLVDSLDRLFTGSLSFVKPDGHQPMLSDSDDTDSRDVLTRGAVLFERGDLKSQGYEMLDYEGIWYYGQKGMETYRNLKSQLPEFCSIHMEQAGYSVMRSGWSSDARYLIFDGGHMDIIRAHGHDDFLHFDLHAFGKDLLLDTGRYTYMENDYRRYFKESFNHNTTSVDGKSISGYQSSWSWKNVAQPREHYWNSQPAFDYVQAGHNGYWRLDDPVQVLRQIFYVKPSYWILVDTFRSHEEHDFTQHFHFAEKLAVGIDPDSSFVEAASADGVKLKLLQLDPVSLSQEECWISRNYNDKNKSTKIEASKKGKGFTRFVTILIPYREEEEPDFTVEKIDVFNTRSERLSETDVTALEMKRGKESEIILFSHDGPNSFQFSGTHLTGEVLFVKRKDGFEQSFVVKV
ncbi:alginate lyase family protein [Pseudalkalibacillus caeni]|uniref:Heparinase n=1 Tax=Exobacillus caeni TaxID=2574798 RepID=A0A5R9F2B4_9BACL|nr:alginate lyase family protein [Pseudalkalibacillus caeni]TLS37221.1 heparinase [Pseudalkalibacillus caeni]